MRTKAGKRKKIKTKISDNKNALKRNLNNIRSTPKKNKIKSALLIKSNSSKAVINSLKDRFLIGTIFLADSIEENGRKLLSGFIKFGNLIEKIGHRVKQP